MMDRRLLRHHLPAVAGILALVAFLSLPSVVPSTWREGMRESAFDLVLQADSHLRSANTDPLRIVVIDIDRRSIEKIGPWPWPRDKVADLIDVIAAAKPAAIAIDILFAEPDNRSPAALARSLGSMTGRPEISALADTLDDGDKRLIQAIGRAPTALGFVLDPDRAQSTPGVPILTRGSPSLIASWHAAGAVGPPRSIVEAAAGLGALSLPGDADGTVRRVPLLVSVGDTPRPGFAAEAIRLAQHASGYLLDSDTRILTIGERAIPLGPDAMLRLAPPIFLQPTIIIAAEIMAGDTTPLADAIVFLGGSAPELGGLRAITADPLAPSVIIQARAAAQIQSGRAPQVLFTSDLVAAAGIVVLALAAIGMGVSLSPFLGAMAVLAVLISVWVAACGLSVGADRLIDPLTPSLGVALVFVATSVTAFAQTRRREARVRRRFEQHLAPAVVDQIVANPDAVKLRGERREVTSLFTDIEGFTSMTHRADPEQLVALLDNYFEGIAAIVFEHGGMIDKMVGDAVHALFNAPLDLADHPRRAVECAIAIRAWSMQHRMTPAASALQLGRTRIGIETGVTVVGDVGVNTKLDYTAYGDAINAAARFEAANKDIGSTICVGPGTAARCDTALFRPLGAIRVRGRTDLIAVFEPWPDDMPPHLRHNYLAACAVIEESPDGAAEMLEQLAAETPEDPVPSRMAQRLRCKADAPS